MTAPGETNWKLFATCHQCPAETGKPCQDMRRGCGHRRPLTKPHPRRIPAWDRYSTCPRCGVHAGNACVAARRFGNQPRRPHPERRATSLPKGVTR